MPTVDNSILAVGSDGTPEFKTGASNDTICLPELQVQASGSVTSVVAQNAAGCLRGLEPLQGDDAPTTQVLYGTKDGLIYFDADTGAIPTGCGVVYRDCTDSELKVITGAEGDILVFNAEGNPTVEPLPATQGFIDYYGIQLQKSASQTIQVGFSQVVVQKTGSVSLFITNTTPILLTLSNNGAAGLDVGAVAPSTYYWIYVIYDSTNATTSVLASLSATAPTMPGTYDYKRLIGLARTTSSSFIADGYYQSDSEVWFGTDADIVIFTNTGSLSGGYASGTISSYVSTNCANNAKFRMSLVGSSAGGEYVVFIANQASSTMAQTGAVYGGNGLSSTTGSKNYYVTFEAQIPVGATSYYNVFATGLSGSDVVALSLSGFSLTFG